MHSRCISIQAWCGITAVALLLPLALAGSAAAQAKEPVRVGVGFSLLRVGVWAPGASGGVLVPVKEIGQRSIGILGAGAVHHRGNTTLISFGGALRLTSTLTPKLRAFVQGGLGVAHRRDSVDENDPIANSRTKLGVLVGGGVLVPLNSRINFMVEADLGALSESGDVAKGGVLTFGVSMPLGKS
jgi:hypothetical protein